MFTNPRVRAVAAAGTALVVVAGIAVGVANTSTAASSRWVTTTVGTGDVTQTYLATGSISRKNTAAAAFSVDGTVKSVAVAVGDAVEAGDVLAVLKKGPLQLAVLEAETSVARANATLYAARHPSSTARASSGGSSSASSSKPSTQTVTIDPKVLSEAASRINLAVLTEAEKCKPVFDSILPSPEPTETATPTASASPEASESAEPTTSADPTTSVAPAETSEPSATPTAEETTEAKPAESSEPSEPAVTTETTEPTPTASASQLAELIEAADPTDAELQECANARAEVQAANTDLQTLVQQLLTPQPSRTTTAKKASSASSSVSVSESQVAAAEADLLEAEQQLQAAKDDLSAAELLAPISGTVGTVGLAKGDSASSGSITIVGEGNAVVSFELPLKTRNLVEVGQAVTVTAAGATASLSGKVTAISALETSGTSGDSPTYSTTASVSDPEMTLAAGAKASVSIPVKSATNVVRVPASAVTPTGTGTATVQVLPTASSETPETVTVSTGTVGGGWVEVTSGLNAGQIVVLADSTAEIPANATRRRTTTSSSSSRSSAATTAAPTGATSSEPSVAPTPTATASR